MSGGCVAAMLQLREMNRAEMTAGKIMTGSPGSGTSGKYASGVQSQRQLRCCTKGFIV